MQGGGVREAAVRSAGRGGFWLPYTDANKARGGSLSHTSPAGPGASRSPRAVFLLRSHSGEQVGGLPTSGDFPGALRAKPVGEQPLGPTRASAAFSSRGQRVTSC